MTAAPLRPPPPPGESSAPPAILDKYRNAYMAAGHSMKQEKGPI